MTISVKNHTIPELKANYRLSYLKKLAGSLSKKTTKALLIHIKKTRLEWGK